MKRDPEKLRAWRQRSKPIHPVNRKRRAKRKAEGKVYGAFHVFVGSQPCCVFRPGECYGDVAGHHLKTVGAGGQDEANEVPLCWFHHREVETGRDAFEWRHGISLDAEAAYLWKRYTEDLP